MTLGALKDLFRRVGCKSVYVKRLASNDNSKNQVYFGPGFGALNLFPSQEIVPDGGPGNATFKAKLSFVWLQSSGKLVAAPNAQLILYPQYPEVRFSGFLRGCSAAPSDLMAGRVAGRLLFLGVTPDSTVVGFVASPESVEARAFERERGTSSIGVFSKLVLPGDVDEEMARTNLLIALRRITKLGWIASKQLDQEGRLGPCNAPQCGGFTLEAELGIPKNSAAQPDFLGWEIKQHSVTRFDRPATGKSITLMTPEPTGGFYKTEGPEAFVREFGYLDKLGRADRMNFGGVHRAGARQVLTGLTMRLRGYDASSQAITNADGAIALVDDTGRVAASWGFAGLLAHWSRKHTKAAYVPSQSRDQPGRQYAYGPSVRLAEQTDGLRLLAAVAKGSVFYDPGIKLENASGCARVKRRSQFRVASRDLPELYERMTLVDLLADG